MSKFYSEEITKESFKELEAFVNFMKAKGHIPLIVGGWAAYAYAKGLGSLDIDVIFLSPYTRDIALQGFFKQHGYKERKLDVIGFSKELVKKIKIGNRGEEIFVDASTAEDSIIDNPKGTIVKWKWAQEDDRLITIDNVAFYVPNPELLLVYKILAAVGRTEKLSIAHQLQKPRITAKIWKDYYDVAALIKNCNFNFSKIQKYLKESNGDNYLEFFKDGLKEHEDALRLAGASYREIVGFLA